MMTQLISSDCGVSLDALRGTAVAHYGVPGMKWGVRKQREPVGRIARARKIGGNSSRRSQALPADAVAARRRRTRRALKIGAVAFGVALATYGGVKMYQNSKNKKAAAARAADMARKMEIGEREFAKAMGAFRDNVSRVGATKARSNYYMPDGSIRTMLYDKATGAMGWSRAEYVH